MCRWARSSCPTSVYRLIADGAGASAVGHGYTYSAHPVSAAVGLEVLQLYEDGLLENGVQGRRAADGRPANASQDHPLVGDVRGRGMLAAVELVTDKATQDAAAGSGRCRPVAIFDRAWNNGLDRSAPSPTASSVMRRRSAARTPTSTAIIDRTRMTLDQTLEDRGCPHGGEGQ